MTQPGQTRINAAMAALMLVVLLMCAPTKAFGYADPGTGTYVYQAVYAAFIGGAFYFRKFLQRFRSKRSGPNK
jgi:hypothetical protein